MPDIVQTQLPKSWDIARVKKVKIILFFESEKLKKCTNNFYHHDFPVSGILKVIMADNRPFEFDQAEFF